MVEKRNLQRFLLPVGEWRPTIPDFGDHFGDFGHKMKDLKNSGIFSISLLGEEIYRIYWMVLCDFTSCQERHKNPGVAEMRQSSLKACGVGRTSLEFCDLVSCETLSVIVRAIAVIVSDLTYFPDFLNNACVFDIALAMLVLRLGRQFYRDMYGNTGEWQHRSRPWRPFWRPGDFGDEMWDLKSTGNFLISALGDEIRIYPDNSM
ncbi:hypothetical protein AVEN_93159-1 [Araneus ventricosus]|uniref:Uncharacterized protein n=1 Tax=Araneus ventricosus TaxID=182803 RepID=A0A4Y2QE54_ARAVE|nr:hypothetical protein AVEN_93159-1 [Araneus ventricosus]